MAAPESAASKDAGVMATSIQQTTFRTIETLIAQLFALMVACVPSTVNCL
jgi:preprotein translocase subunit SecF